MNELSEKPKDIKRSLLFQAAMICIIVSFVFTALILLQELLVPFIIAALMAMVMLPLCQKLETYFNKFFSVSCCVTLIIALVSGLIFLFYYYLNMILTDIPLFAAKATEKFERLRNLIEQRTGITSEAQMDYVNTAYEKWVSSSNFYVQDIILGLTEAFGVFALIIVYIFFFLLYRHKIKNFILKLFPEKNHMRISIIINHTQDMSQHYLTGLLIELGVLGTLNAVGLLLVGVKQAIFFGYLAGLLNIIPYVGVLIGSIFPMIIAFIFQDSFSAVLAVIAVLSFNQFIDNNILTPKIIGSHIQVNALATIVVIIVGGMMWGIPGMILFIPLIGIVKIVCDFVIVLHPLSYLLGEDIEESGEGTWLRIRSFLSKKLLKGDTKKAL